MRVDQALFGEARSGHSLLGWTGDAGVGDDITPRTDLPDQVPGGMDLPPFLSIYPVGTHVVFTRTSPDPYSKRHGMVRTHALVLDANDARTLADISRLIERLNQGPPAVAELVAFELGGDGETKSSTPPSALAAALTTLQADGRVHTVVIAEEAAAFEAAIIDLWRKLPPAIRTNLYVRISFSRRDIDVANRPHIVWTPSRLRWQASDILDVGNISPLGTAARTLAEGDETLLAFAFGLEIVVQSFEDLANLGRTFDLIQLDGVSQVASGLKLAAVAQPEPTKGRTGKQVLINTLASRIQAAGTAALPPLRNLDLLAFETPAPVWSAVTQLIAASTSHDSATNWLGVLGDASRTGAAVESWKRAVWAGVLATSEDFAPILAKAISDLIPIRRAAALEVIERCPPTQARDQALALNLRMTSPSQPDPGDLLEALARLGWSRAHAALATATLGLETAIAQQMAIPASEPGLDDLLKQATPSQRIDVAISLGNERIIAAAAVDVAAAPGRLGRRDFAHHNVQRLWAEALRLAPEAWQGPADPVAAARTVFGQRLINLPVADGLLAALARSPAANLTGWDGLPTIWSHLDDPEKGHILSATAAGWLTALGEGAATSDPEGELLVWVRDPLRLRPYLHAWATDGHSAALEAFQRLDLPEALFQDWMIDALSTTASISVPIAAAIGDLVRQRNWRTTARALLSAYVSGRKDLKPALAACPDLLTILDRLVYDLSPPSVDERWDVMAALAADLYPKGPHQDLVWERAGGKIATLVGSGSGLEQWRHALGRVRQGAPVKAAKLTKVMREDYPHNSELKALAGFKEFGGAR